MKIKCTHMEIIPDDPNKKPLCRYRFCLEMDEQGMRVGAPCLSGGEIIVYDRTDSYKLGETYGLKISIG